MEDPIIRKVFKANGVEFLLDKEYKGIEFNPMPKVVKELVAEAKLFDQERIKKILKERLDWTIKERKEMLKERKDKQGNWLTTEDLITYARNVREETIYRELIDKLDQIEQEALDEIARNLANSNQVPYRNWKEYRYRNKDNDMKRNLIESCVKLTLRKVRQSMISQR